MPNDLTAARLRELIAAASKHGLKAYPNDTPYTFLDWGGPGGRLRQVDAQLIVALVNSAPALADALEIAQNMQLEFPLLLEECRKYWKTPDWLDALRAAKEAADRQV